MQASVDLTDGSETVTIDGRDERARRLAVHAHSLPARAREVTVRVRSTVRRRDRRGASRSGSRRASSPTASGSRSPSASPTPIARRSRRSCARRSRRASRSAARSCSGPRSASPSPRSTARAVSDDVLSPGWTSLPRSARPRDGRCHRRSCREGENVLGATIAGAWYTEKYGFFDVRRPPLRHAALASSRSFA